MVDVNYWAVLAGAIASMVIGALWYGPLFGKQWMALSGFSREQLESQKAKGMGKRYGLMFVGSLLMAFVLSHSLVFASTYLDINGYMAGLMSAFWNWLGFIVPVTIGSVLWDGKPWKLWILNNAYHLVTLSVMSVILALWV